MKLEGCFNVTKTLCMSKDRGKLDFSGHDPFKKCHVSFSVYICD